VATALTGSPAAAEEIGQTGYSAQDAVAASPSLREGKLPAGLNGSTAFLLGHVMRRETVTLGDLADVLVGHFGLTRERALADVATFASTGQMAGVLSFHPVLRTKVKGRARFLLDLLMIPVRGWFVPPSIQRQYFPYSVAHMVVSSVRAQSLLGLLVVAVCAIPLSFIDGFWSGVGRTFVAGLATGVIGGLVVLGVLHEAAHAAVATGCGSRPVAVYRQGMRVGLQRIRLSPLRDLAVAVAGPLTAVAVGAVVLVALLAVDRSAPTTYARAAMIGLLIATSLQGACLVPPAADGNVILASWRRLRKARHEGEDTVT
jgi:hypothetical protein